MFKSTQLFEASYKASGSQEFTKHWVKNICQKIKAVYKGTGKKLLIGVTLLHSTHRKSEINLLDIFQKCSISFVIIKIDLKADINTACIQNKFF